MKRIKIIALFSAVVAAIAMFIFLNEVSKPDEGPKTRVVTAAVKITENTTITDEMLNLSELPTEAVLPSAVKDKKEIIGKVMQSDTLSGEQILYDRIVELGDTTSGSLDFLITPGMRAITISVTETSGLKGMVKPGNSVDVVAYYQYDQSAGDSSKSIAEAKILVQNVKVMAVDKIMTKEGKTDGEIYTTLTLEVTPEEAVLISYGENAGVLRAILRSPLDETKVGGFRTTIDKVKNN